MIDRGMPVVETCPVCSVVKISCVALRDAKHGVTRRMTWTGETRKILIRGLPSEFSSTCGMSFDLPDGATCHPCINYNDDTGVVVTVFQELAVKLLGELEVPNVP